jgi:hypothetical protein
MTLGVEIGVDMTPDGAHVIAMYVLPDSTRCVFYSQFHPQQRTWVGLTDEETNVLWMEGEANINFEHFSVVAYEIEAKLKEKNT